MRRIISWSEHGERSQGRVWTEVLRGVKCISWRRGLGEYSIRPWVSGRGQGSKVVVVGSEEGSLGEESRNPVRGWGGVYVCVSGSGDDSSSGWFRGPVV